MPVAAPMHPSEEREAIASCSTPRWIYAGLGVILRRSMRHQAGTRPEILYVPITFRAATRVLHSLPHQGA